MHQTLAEYVRRTGRMTREAFLGQVTAPVLVEIGANADALEISKRDSFHTEHVKASDLAARALTPDRREIMFVQKRAASVFSGHIGVGRTPNLDICIARMGISKFHAHFSQAEGGQYQLTDKDSKNGTFVDGERLESGQAVRLEDGAEIRFAAHAFRFMLPARFYALVQSMTARG